MISEHEVVVVGGGPTGLMLAGELALAKIDVAVVERRQDQSLGGLRAGGLHARSIEILDQRGIADRFLAAGQIAQVAGFAGTPFDLTGFPTRHPYGLGLRQPEIERLLTEWTEELSIRFYRECEVRKVTSTGTQVDVLLRDGRRIEAQYLVGCDGSRSMVRQEVGIDFPGSAATFSHIIATVEVLEKPELEYTGMCTGFTPSRARSTDDKVHGQGQRKAHRGRHSRLATGSFQRLSSPCYKIAILASSDRA